jgi:CRISPR-associated protein Cas1
LRGWEGASSRRYFQAISELLPEGYRFEKRSTHPAQDAFNATLNYAYGMLYAKVESSLIKAGIDPYVGIFHRDEYNRPALAFDVIEKYRIWADYPVVQLFRQDAFCEECFIQERNAWLLDGLGKRILIQSMNDYLGEIILLDKMERSRATHIDLYAQKLAKEFLKYGTYSDDRK